MLQNSLRTNLVRALLCPEVLKELFVSVQTQSDARLRFSCTHRNLELFVVLYISLAEGVITVVWQMEFIDKAPKLFDLERKVQSKGDGNDKMQIIKDRAVGGEEERVSSEILNNIRNSVCILQ